MASLRDRPFEQLNNPVERAYVTEAHQVALNEQIILAALTGEEDANYDITLPNVVEAAGRTYAIYTTGTAGTGETITVEDDGNGRTTLSKVIEKTDGRVVAYSTGESWEVFAEDLS